MVVNPKNPRLRRVTYMMLSSAAVYGVAIVVGGFLLPVYRTSSSSSSGADVNGTDTLVGVNGRGVVFVLVVPLVATVLVACALWLRPRRGALPVAWTITGLLAAFNLLAMLSIGIFVLPVTAALIIACHSSRSPAKPLEWVAPAAVT